ncbi:unnamed protein product [Leuciscus chuanchicus]
MSKLPPDATTSPRSRRHETRDTTVAGDVFLSSPHAWCHNFKSISGGAYREVIQFHVGCVGPSNAVNAYVHALYSATRRFRVKLQRLLSFLLSNVHSSAGARRLPGSISTGFLTLLTTPDQDRTTSKSHKLSHLHLFSRWKAKKLKAVFAEEGFVNV